MALKTYLDTYHVGLKEFNNMASSKITQLRSERTKAIYQYFHESVLPAMSVVEPKIFKAIVKSLSQVYRNKDIDVEDAIGQIEPLLRGTPHIDTRTPSPSRPDPEIPESPSHKIAEKKKMTKKCVKPVVSVATPTKKTIKKIVKDLKPMEDVSEEDDE